MIETTVYLRDPVVLKLEKTSALYGLSRSKLVSLLCQKAFPSRLQTERSFTRVRYQAREKPKDWKRLHLYLSEKDYELFLDIRKFFKVSVSLFLTQAIDLFLDKVINEIRQDPGGTDNYMVTCYSIVRTITSLGDICWKLYWGLPESVP
jgi:hypothetical protein